jgi:NADPH-dependent curcumin reductase CurA
MAAAYDNREIRLKARPQGLPAAEHFEVVNSTIPAPAKGEVLVRNRFFLVSPSLRQMVSEGAEDVPGVPFPALRPGDTLFGEAVGEVVEAPNGSGLAAGDMVQHVYGWRDYASVPLERCERLSGPLPDPLGYVGYLGHGWTAYAALTRGVKIRPGDTVFVSSAAGAIGSMAGQISRLLGARRIIGSTSSREKAARLVEELGYDAGVVRGEDAFLTLQLIDASAGGIDVFVDTVGGEQLQAALAAAREKARFVILGTLASQLASSGTGRKAPSSWISRKFCSSESRCAVTAPMMIRMLDRSGLTVSPSGLGEARSAPLMWSSMDWSTRSKRYPKLRQDDIWVLWLFG